MELQLIRICFWEHQNDPTGKNCSPLFWRASFVYGAVGIVFLLQGFLEYPGFQFDKYPYEARILQFRCNRKVFLVFALCAGVLLVRLSRRGVNPVELHLRHRNCTFHG